MTRQYANPAYKFSACSEQFGNNCFQKTYRRVWFAHSLNCQQERAICGAGGSRKVCTEWKTNCRQGSRGRQQSSVATINGNTRLTRPTWLRLARTANPLRHFIVTVEEPDEPTTQEEIAEEHEEAKAQTQDEMGDDDWFATLPLAAVLTGIASRRFGLTPCFGVQPRRPASSSSTLRLAWTKGHRKPLRPAAQNSWKSITRKSGASG